MSETQMEKAINTAVFSLEMEGFSIDEKAKKLCKRLLNNEITMEQYVALVKEKAGVSA